ncbi:hypothetical protein E2542_SST27429 [Spatholobus suberectus]|nr:hypothetical protein E2542_SST27429 [Spatholobus suberectus]
MLNDFLQLKLHISILVVLPKSSSAFPDRTLACRFMPFLAIRVIISQNFLPLSVAATMTSFSICFSIQLLPEQQRQVVQGKRSVVVAVAFYCSFLLLPHSACEVIPWAEAGAEIIVVSIGVYTDKDKHNTWWQRGASSVTEPDTKNCTIELELLALVKKKAMQDVVATCEIVNSNDVENDRQITLHCQSVCENPVWPETV